MKIVTLFAAPFVFCAPQAFAAPATADQFFLATSYNINWPLLFFGLLFGGSIYAIVSYRDRERLRKIEEQARSLGWTFRRQPTRADNDLPIGCYLAETGRNPAVSNVLEIARTDELNFVLFDYEYTVSYGKSEHTPHQTIARIKSPLLKLPSFLLFPETIFSKIAKVFGQTDVNFEDSPVFSDQYILRGQNEAALRAIFSPALRNALEPLEHLTIEGADDVLFIFRCERRIKAEEFVSRIEEGKRILKLFFEAQQATG
jgi:carbonic anhydrase